MKEEICGKVYFIDDWEMKKKKRERIPFQFKQNLNLIYLSDDLKIFSHERKGSNLFDRLEVR